MIISIFIVSFITDGQLSISFNEKVKPKYCYRKKILFQERLLSFVCPKERSKEKGSRF